MIETSTLDSLALRIQNLGKCYRKYARNIDKLWQLLPNTKKQYFEEHWALRNVSFSVKKGQTIGVIGHNGSGKSTLLQLLAGTVTPTEGSITIAGRVTALLELGSGFHPDFNGRENAKLQANILGIGGDDLEARLERIAAFADIGNAWNEPLRTYSSGMIVRLGFAIATCVDPDVLLVDEALAVGDLRFQQRCMTRIKQLRDEGVSILLVTHDLEACKRICEETHVLEKGKLLRSGPSDAIANWYLGYMTRDLEETAEVEYQRVSVPENRLEKSLFRHGDGQGKIERVTMVTAEGDESETATLGEEVTLCVRASWKRQEQAPIIGFYLRDRLGTEMIGANTHTLGMRLPLSCDEGCDLRFRFVLRLRPGMYTICVGMAYDPQVPRYLDWIDDALHVQVVDPQPGRVIYGLIHEEIQGSIGVEQPNSEHQGWFDAASSTSASS